MHDCELAVLFACRYAEEGKEVHPYKPWADADTKAEQHYRAYKACQNSVEWTVYMVPCSVLHAIYSPAIPVVGKYAPWCGTAFALLWAAGNTEYVRARVEPEGVFLFFFGKRSTRTHAAAHTPQRTRTRTPHAHAHMCSYDSDCCAAGCSSLPILL